MRGRKGQKMFGKNVPKNIRCKKIEKYFEKMC